ncbi:MAG: peptidyl-prolyl cis-trans isomerase [Chloroflexi bacterium]|nr:peptidyl-prolyl cis-trans isomerase [Chloroflexota bacterium]
MGNRPLAEVRDSIRETLHAAKEKDYIAGYLRDLRARASVSVDYQLLAVPDLMEEELTSYYLARQADFRELERVRVQEVHFEFASKDKEQEAAQKAEKVLARVQAGEDFAMVAQELAPPNAPAEGIGADEVVRGARGPEFDEKVFPLREGEVSPVFKEGDSYRVVKVLERRRERKRSFDEVRDEIRRKLAEERATAIYAGNKEKTLFTIRGRRFTLGEFLDEYQNFPPDVQARYRDLDAKKELVDRLVERLLVLDSASSQMLDVKNKKEIEEARQHVLAEILHQEEVQDKLQATDEEVKKFYDQHRSHYVAPPRVKISYIRVAMGFSEDSRKKARERIDEVAKRLQSARDRPDAFAEVAKEFSEDPETAAKGGDLDRWLTRQDDSLSHALAHDFTERVFDLKLGETSPLIAMGDSNYIVRVRERQESMLLTFEQAKAVAREDLLAEKHDRALRDMEAELARRMKLVVYDNRVIELSKEITSGQSSVIGNQSEPPTAH